MLRGAKPVKKFPAAIYYPLQWTWGILQNIAGLCVFLVLVRRPHFCYERCVATVWNRGESLSLGMFVFVSKHLKGDLQDEDSELSRVTVHEYGHTFQSLVLGPLYLLVISLPSGVWCMIPGFENMRRRKKISYHSLYTERWANHLGLNITKRLPEGYKETHEHTWPMKKARAMGVPNYKEIKDIKDLQAALEKMSLKASPEKKDL